MKSTELSGGLGTGYEGDSSMTNSTPLNMSVDELLAHLWMDAENFTDDIHKHREPNRDIPEQKQAEAKAALSSLFDTFAERVIGEDESILQSMFPAQARQRNVENQLKSKQRARVQHIKKEMGL